jgi:microcystin-dependent protein
MAQPYVGEIRMFAGNFAPAGWMFCEGQLLPISENETLFQLIGTTYGGDGQSTFALPDLRGRLPLHQGNGFILAETGGAEQITLTVNQIPAHSHPQRASAATATQNAPATNVFAQAATVDAYVTSGPFVALSPQSNAAAGGSQPHTNLQPYLCVDFIISLFGIFPSPTRPAPTRRS